MSNHQITLKNEAQGVGPPSRIINVKQQQQQQHFIKDLAHSRINTSRKNLREKLSLILMTMVSSDGKDVVTSVTEGSMNWFEIFSILLGWSYTLCWGISFYPQVLLNFKRKSVKGVSIDFLVLNVLGFICYSISTSALLFSKTVRKEYSDQFLINDQANQQLSSSSNRLKTPNVRFNDLVFSLHALILSLITWYQSLIYKRDSNQRVSTITKRLILLISLFLALQLFVTINSESSREDYPSRSKLSERTGSLSYIVFPASYNYLNLIRSVSSVKVLISIIKYLPQLNMNFKRKSTIGWSIGNIILDLLGGILSLFQMVLDSGLAHDWSSLTSNPGKLGISLVSIGFDFLFMIQHYVLYNQRNRMISGEQYHQLEGEEQQEGPGGEE